jgi:hypothetical protein
MTDRLHHCVAYGLDTAACDACCGYDSEAYGEEPARYLDEQPEGNSDPRELEYETREPEGRDTP